MTKTRPSASSRSWLPPDGVEVEFLDRDGRTRCVATLGVADVLVHNCERTKVA